MHLNHPNAKKVAEALLSCAEELETRASISIGSSKTLALIDAAACRDAIEVIMELDNECYRVKSAIGIYCYGQMKLNELRTYWKTWNDRFSILKRDKLIKSLSE